MFLLQKKKQIIEQLKKFIQTKKDTIKDRIIIDIKLFFGQEDDYCKSVRVGKFWSNNYIEYESSSDKNKNLSVIQCLNKLKTYLKYIINNLQQSGTWKVQLTIAINFISSKDDEVQVMHSKSENIEVMTYL